MDVPAIIDRLEKFPPIVVALTDGLSDEHARWRPESGNWSVLEVVCHLIDEEVEDFRQRLRLTLESPGTPWPTLDPPKAAIDRKYNEQNLAERVAAFVSERKASIQWLRSLKDPDWDQSYLHPRVGKVPAGLLLASWVAHDQLHIRQIAKRFYELSLQFAHPYPIDYAGEW